VSNSGTRWQSSVLTFGPVGRLVCTVLLLLVLVWFVVYAGPFGLVGVVVWAGWVLPRALRDTWRRAPLPDTDLSRLREIAAREALEPEQRAHPVFDPDHQPPGRW
jgi:hypothetical protein